MKYLWIFLLVLFVFSCVKEYTCPNEWLVPVLKGYAQSEADTIKIKRFEKGSNFTVLIDSSAVPISANGSSPKDSTFSFYLIPSFSSHDVQIINPFDNKMVSVSDMIFEPREGKRSSCFNPVECYSPLISYKLNGVAVMGTDSLDNEYVVITK
jgi:hypothetical protein